MSANSSGPSRSAYMLQVPMSGSRRSLMHVVVLVWFTCVSGIEDKVAADTHEAEGEVDALDEEGKQQKEELSLLRAEKQQLRKKVHVATQERGQMQHAATALGIDNVALHKAAEQLISKIDKVHRDRLAFMSESEKWRAEAAQTESELEKLQVKLQGAQMLAISSVLASGGGSGA